MFYQTAFLVCAFLAVAKCYDLTYVGGKEAAKACGEELKIKNVKKALKPGSNDPNAKCLRYCIAGKLNLITQNGEPTLEKLHKYDNITEFAQECSKQHTEADKCERVNQISACMKEKYDQLMQSYSDECASETGTKVENYKSLFKNVMASAFNKKLHCYYRCMLVKTTLMDSESNINIANIKPLLVGTKYENIGDHVDECSKNNNQKDACTKASQRIICVGRKVVMGGIFG